MIVFTGIIEGVSFLELGRVLAADMASNRADYV